MPSDSRLSTLQNEIVSLARRVDEIDIRSFESYPADVLVAELPPPVLERLRLAEACLVEIVRVCDGETKGDDISIPFCEGSAPLPYLQFEHALEDTVERGGGSSISLVADIAFLASLELRQRRERLERIGQSQKHLAIIAECDGSLRRLRKALSTIDQAMARAGVGPARLDYASELEISLEVRRAYAKLRARIRDIGEPHGDTFYVQLRAVGTAFATVVGWKGYSNLRVRDRIQMRELQRRLLDWFKSDRDPAAGLDLWKDLDAFVQMLSDVNRRQELREHDARVVHDALRTLAGGADVIPESMMRPLERLLGLDAEVDGLLEDKRADRASVWRAPLERLARELPRSGGSQ